MTTDAFPGRPGRTEGREEQPRLFVAIELEPPMLAALGQVQAALQRRPLEGLRWVRPEGIHLTLKFLGDTPANRLPAIRRALAGAVLGVPPLRLSLDTPGSFGSRQSPRVVWVGLRGDIEELGRLQRRVDEALEKEGFPREQRAFSPHLTLARIRPESALALAAPLAEALRDLQVPDASMETRVLSLMRSRLNPRGAEYTCVESWGLEAGD